MGNSCGGGGLQSSQNKGKHTKSLRLKDEKKLTQQAKVVLLGNIAVGKYFVTTNGGWLSE